MLTHEELQAVKKEVKAIVSDAVKYADMSPDPPSSLAKELEYPTAIDTDYNEIPQPPFADTVNKRTIPFEQMGIINAHIAALRKKAAMSEISICEAANLAIHEEMLRDPSTTSKFTCLWELDYREHCLIYFLRHFLLLVSVQAEDLQSGSSYGIPGLTQQTYGSLRASDEIIDEGHIIGKVSCT